MKIPFEAPLKNKGDSYSLIMTKDKNCSASGKLSGAVFTYDIDFHPSQYSKFTSGTMVVGTSYN